MKIAIPTNDRKTIAKRTGRAEEFAIYQIENAQILGVTYIKNTHTHEDQGNNYKGQHQGKDKKHHENHNHAHEHGEHNHDELIALFKDIEILLVRAIGKHMRNTLKKGNINYQLIKIDLISDILEQFLKA
jgi:predicted Fe-Mo cluster-binding NifX family protein